MSAGKNEQNRHRFQRESFRALRRNRQNKFGKIRLRRRCLADERRRKIQKLFARSKRLLSFSAKIISTRTDAVVALGGGVVGDLAGFAAAVYQRGLAFLQIPTTLSGDDRFVGRRENRRQFRFRQKFNRRFSSAARRFDRCRRLENSAAPRIDRRILRSR
jgi:hypothetical protein